MDLDELKVGSIYFLLTFHDRELLVPDISTNFFLGINLISQEAGDSDTIYFQSAGGYYQLGKWENGLDAVKYGVITMKEEFLDSVFDYEGLKDQLEIMKRGGARFYKL